MTRPFRIFTGFVLVVFGVVFLWGLFLSLSLLEPISSHDMWKEVRIPEGATYSEGIHILKEAGLMNHEYVFLALGRLTMVERRLRAGFYNLNTSMTPLQVFDRLKRGMIVLYEITIPEGSRLEDILAKLSRKGLVGEDDQEIVRDRVFLSSLNIVAPSLEGYLFPDTYNFAKGVEPRDIFRIMVHRLREKYSQPLSDRMGELGMSENEVLTLASIIEHEAIYDRERPLISAVYHNRLKKNMRLQADPTVVYGIKRMQDGITRRDLRRKTPYNTYVIRGLPPGPISSPGLKSIEAALYPSDVDYMYFVSKNDGTHYFSRTGREHLKAVMLYQRNSRASRRRVPAISVKRVDDADMGSARGNEGTIEDEKTD